MPDVRRERMISNQYISYIELRRDMISSLNEYPFCLNAVKHLEKLQLHPSVTFFVGENGTGKSTLLEAIAIAWGFNPEGGSKNFHFGTRSSHSKLHEYIRLIKGVRQPQDGYFLRAESFFNVATDIEKMDALSEGLGRPIADSYGEKSLHEQSHGESFLSLFTERFRGNGLYILDEPEAALSPSRQMAVLARIHDLVKADSQFLIATHSPIIMSYPNSTIYQLSEKGNEVMGYTETEHYNVAREFLANHNRMLDILLEE